MNQLINRGSTNVLLSENRAWICCITFVAALFVGTTLVFASAPSNVENVLFSFPADEWDLHETTHGILISRPGAGALSIPGTPYLPTQSKLIQVPQNMRLSILNVESTFSKTQLVDLAFCDNSFTQGLQIDGFDKAEEHGQFWPANGAVVETATAGGTKIARIVTFPVQYNPTLKCVRFADSIRLTYELVPEGSIPELQKVTTSRDTEKPTELLPPMYGTAASYAGRRAGAEVKAQWKIPVSKTGLYKLDYDTLALAGFSTPIQGSQLRLYCKTQEVACLTSTQDAWSPGDNLLFYGEAYDSLYTSNNIYWLGYGGSGLRMTNITTTWDPASPTNLRYSATIPHSRQSIMVASCRPYDDSFDHWFSSVLWNNKTTNIPVNTSDRTIGSTAQLEVTLFGFGEVQSHSTSVRVNGNTLTNVTYSGQTRVDLSLSFPSSYLTDGNSFVTFVQSQYTGLLKDFSLTFPRSTIAQQGVLSFSTEHAFTNHSVSGMQDTNGFYLLDISNPKQPAHITALQPNGNGFLFSRSANADYFACSTSAIESVSSGEKIEFRNLADTNRQADLIAVCPYSLRRSVYQLLRYRHGDTLSLAVAPLEDIYNEFSYGIKDADAIKQFLGYAYHHWQGPTPSFVLLIGDGSYDEKNVLGFNPVNAVPVHMGPTSWRWSPLDPWYVTVDGTDWIPDMAISRIPAQSNQQVLRLLNKVKAFESIASNDAWRTRALLTADDTDGSLNFKSSSQTYVKPHLQTAGFTIAESYRDDFPAGTVYNTINGQFGNNMAINYIGHGDIDAWTADPVWNTTDTYALSNTRYPIVTIFTCQNGAFHEVNETSLAEAFVTDQYAASACVAPTSLSDADHADALADAFYEALVIDKEQRLGTALKSGWIALWGQEGNVNELQFYQIFGDAAQKVNP